MSEVEATESTLYLTFRLENELLALDVSRVREVLDLCAITRVPRTPEFMRGVINLRGTVIPVVDLRHKFGVSRTESTIDARIVVIEINLDAMETLVGVLTDSVHDVIEIHHDWIDASPETSIRWRREYIKGIGKYDDNFILLLDIDRVFSGTEMEAISDSQGKMAA
jgi:purine-binding chemotaxis protein CheW